MNSDCLDDRTKKRIPGCDAEEKEEPTGPPEVDEEYCHPWSEYEGDMELFQDCCNEAKQNNVLDSECVSLTGIKPTDRR
jgi:hypothetical protein